MCTLRFKLTHDQVEVLNTVNISYLNIPLLAFLCAHSIINQNHLRRRKKREEEKVDTKIDRYHHLLGR